MHNVLHGYLYTVAMKRGANSVYPQDWWVNTCIHVLMSLTSVSDVGRCVCVQVALLCICVSASSGDSNKQHALSVIPLRYIIQIPPIIICIYYIYIRGCTWSTGDTNVEIHYCKDIRYKLITNINQLIWSYYSDHSPML